MMIALRTLSPLRSIHILPDSSLLVRRPYSVKYIVLYNAKLKKRI